MKQISVVKTVLKLALVGVAGLLVACGGSSSDSDGGVADASISGTISAAPVFEAEVNVVDSSGNHVAGPEYTDINGQYTGLVIPNGSLGQDLIVKSTGGTFTDEATGNQNVPAGEMLAYVAAGSISNGSSVSATPGSTIIANLIKDPGNNINNLADAEAVFEEAFGYKPDVSVTPVNAANPPVGASIESKLDGLRAAAFSQLAWDLGLLVAEQFEMLTALTKDLSDEKLDGVDKSGPVTLTIQGVNTPLVIDIQNRFATALLNFHDNQIPMINDTYGADQTGLTSAQIGTLPFAKVALTNNGAYKIKYIPGMMPAMEGKTTFKLQITDLDGEYVTTAAPRLTPKMYMTGMAHTTPVTEVTYDGAEGSYTATIYYLMSSMMGYWDFEVDVDGDTETTRDDVAYFYPTVMMQMGDTNLVKLQGVDDKVMSMMTGTMGRPYRIFKESLMNNEGSYDFSVFIVAQENMMSFPALVSGLILNEGDMMSQLIIDCPGIVVSVSVNDGAWSPALSDCTDGVWTIGGLTLNDAMDEQNQLKLRLTVNGEVKTTDGEAQVIDVNDFQTFTVTPNPSMSMI